MLPALCLPHSPPLRVRPSRFICTNVGLQGLLVLGLPAPLVPHSASLSPATASESSPPRCPSPPLLPVWMNVYFVFPWCWTPLLFDFLSVLVVQGGAVCLPTPPSWFSSHLFHFRKPDGYGIVSHSMCISMLTEEEEHVFIHLLAIYKMLIVS